jgi:sulfur-oxidizing protein SoxX
VNRGSAAVAAALAALLAASGATSQPVAVFRVEGDAIPAALTRTPGDPARGRTVALDRTLGNCLLCHAIPGTNERFPGDVGPDLKGVGARLAAGQLRLRVVDSTRINAGAVMPAYHRTADLTRVAPAYRDRPVLSAQDVEDVVAFLATLREP